MPSTVTEGITLFTTHVRRATPDTLDPKLNAHSKLNDIAACIQAFTAGADEALMLDPHGFVATCNSTHFFVVVGTPEEPEVWTSDGRFCLDGITRGNVLEVCRGAGIAARETTFSLTDVYSRPGGVRDRHLRRAGAGAQRRRPHHRLRRARPGRRAAPAAVRRPRRRRRRRHGPRRDRRRGDPGRDVVRPAQHLDRDDARLGEPARHRRRRRAVLRGVPRAHRARPPRPRRGDRLAADRPRPRGRRPARAAARRAARSTTPST